MKGAIDDYTMVLMIRPNYASIYYYRSTLYNHLGQNKEALEDMKKAIELKTDLEGAKGVKVYMSIV